MEHEILIFTPKKTNRLVYTLRHVFEYRMKSSFRLTQDPEAFRIYQGSKLNYSSIKIEDFPQVIPSNILFEKRLQQPQVDIEEHDGLQLLFANATKDLHHDVLGAVFYLLSRYEEYFPFRKDEHDRFCAKQSLANKHDFVTKPLVDHYIIRFASWLNSSLQIEAFKPSQDFKHVITLDVDQLYMYKAKGLARTVLSLAKAGIKDQEDFSKRTSTLFVGKPDPIDLYDEFLDAAKSKELETILFFQVGDSTRFDINNPVHLPRIKSKINELSLRTKIGIHPSYFTSENEEMMTREFGRFNAVSSMKLYRSRQHYLRFKIPQTHRWLEELGITEEYSMAFADENGFRASTAFPFVFYDLEQDESTNVTVHPTCFLDITSVRNCSNQEQSINELTALYNEVKQVGGHFITVWHAEVLKGFDVPLPSQPLYDHLLEHLV
jgi:hypothetical protein